MEVYMLLTHKNLTIRNADYDDAALLCRWWNNGAIMAHAGFPQGLNTSPEKIAHDLAADSDDTYRRLIAEVGHVPVGEMSYRNTGDRTAEIGIKICDVSQQGKGYGTLFLKMLISGLFAAGYDRIILDTNTNNTRAQHVYEKLGFQKMLVRCNCWTDQLGRLQSAVDYELHKSQFESLF